MDSTKEKQSKWLAVAVLAVVFISSISIIAVQEPSSSEVTKSCEEVAAELAASGQIPPRKVSLEKGAANLPASMEKAPEETIDAINSGVTEATPRIEAICFSHNSLSLASIGGQLVREGDIVDGFRIIKIYPGRVEFEKDGKTVTGVFPPPRTSVSPKSDNILQKQVGYKSSAKYGVQHRQPSYSIPRASENGSYYGQISENTGRPKTVYVRGYYRKDGTYVRSHYRSPPSR